MSIRYMNFVWELRLPPVEKLLLLKLADNASDLGECYPSIRLVAEQCSVSERTAQRTIKQLKESGYLSIERRYRTDGSQTSNRYNLKITNSPGDKLSPHPDSDGGTGVARRTPQPDEYVTQTTNEPNTETPLQQVESRPRWELPSTLSNAEKQSAEVMLNVLDQKLGQTVVDELAGRMRSATVNRPIRYLSKLINLAASGKFTPEAALKEREYRHEQARRTAGLEQVRSPPMPEKSTFSYKSSQLPDHMQKQLRRMREQSSSLNSRSDNSSSSVPNRSWISAISRTTGRTSHSSIP